MDSSNTELTGYAPQSLWDVRPPGSRPKWFCRAGNAGPSGFCFPRRFRPCSGAPRPSGAAGDIAFLTAKAQKTEASTPRASRPLGPRSFIGKGDVDLGPDLGTSKFDSRFDDGASARNAFCAGYFIDDNFGIAAEVAENDLAILTAGLNTRTLSSSWNVQRGSLVVPYVQAGAKLADNDHESL